MEGGTITNRELVGVILLAAMLLLAMSKGGREVRSSLKDVARAAASRSIVVPLLLYVAWVLAALWPAARVGLWTDALWKPTILWLVLSGSGLLFNLSDAIEKPGFFKSAFVRTVQITAVLEFFAALKSFPFWLELPSPSVAVLAVGVSIVAGRSEDQESARRVADGYLVFFGVAAVSWSLYFLIRDWDTVDRALLLREFLLPLWLTPVALVYMYGFAVVAAHQQSWKRLRIWKREGPLWRQRLGILLRCNIRLGAHRLVRGRALPEIARSGGLRETWKAINDSERRRQEEQDAASEAQRRLEDNAGLVGLDGDGRQLDQREFAETRAALRWLGTCQMGHYRSRGGEYKADLLPIVESHFERDGLPADHGVELRVSEDGQQWRAWRKTITGWCFAIGASTAPPDQWFYDGPSPPWGYPVEPEWDRFAPGAASTNWD
jgi:hypothetical protein